jgi:hypothetical protein
MERHMYAGTEHSIVNNDLSWHQNRVSSRADKNLANNENNEKIRIHSHK